MSLPLVLGSTEGEGERDCNSLSKSLTSLKSSWLMLIASCTLSPPSSFSSSFSGTLSLFVLDTLVLRDLGLLCGDGEIDALREIGWSVVPLLLFSADGERDR
jgi:hypothetical protein